MHAANRNLLTLFLVGALAAPAAGQVTYDIVYVRQPRYGDDINTIWPEVFHPPRAPPGRYGGGAGGLLDRGRRRKLDRLPVELSILVLADNPVEP